MLKVLHGVIDANKEPLFLSVNVESEYCYDYVVLLVSWGDHGLQLLSSSDLLL